MAQFGSYPSTTVLEDSDKFLIAQSSSGQEKTVTVATIRTAIGGGNEFTTIKVTPNNNGLPEPFDANQVIGHFGNIDGARPAVLIDGAGAPALLYLKQAGGTVAAPTATSGFIGGIGWMGFTPAGTTPPRAQINATTTEVWTDSQQGVQLEFVVTGTGGTSTAQAMVINSAGIQGRIGATAPNIGKFTAIETPAYESNNGNFIFRQWNGGVSPSDTLNGDSLGYFSARGYDGGFTTDRVKIDFKATQNWTGLANGSSIVLSATPTGSATLTPALTITTSTATFSGSVNVTGAMNSATISANSAVIGGNLSTTLSGNITSSGTIVSGSTIKTANPPSGISTAVPWYLGGGVSDLGGVAFDTNNYIEVELDGVLRKIALAI